MAKKVYKFIFLTIPAFGHINPMLPVMTELVKAGHRVIVYNNPEFEKIIKSTGAEFRLPPIKIKMPDFKEFKDSFKIAESGLEATKIFTPVMIEIFKKDKPDCIVHDSLSPWSKIISQYLRIPAVALVPSMAINLKVLLKSKINKDIFFETIFKIKRSINIYKQFNDLYRQYGFKPPLVFDVFSNAENLNIIFTSRSIQIEESSFKSNYKFVGPSIYRRNEQLLGKKIFRKKSRTIYISLGTIYNDDINFYKICFNAFKNIRDQVFMSIGKDIKRSDLGKIPENFYISEYLPQLQILEKADIFLTHGGMNSINESLYYGVPMIIFPQMLEQKANAYRMEELRVGIMNKSKLTETLLIKLVNTIYNNDIYLNNAKRHSSILKKTGGYKEATKYILDYLN